ncbi:hypothetical protein E3N88_20638 [Mikania micrantha]|uniref:Replication factor A C-terminal domain-containing protein n=1 Tax=Mikania micrantha TaxID=192012 RepID=A0A5N6NK54_9ASTR|nr:hypothetical protein E3N88_20638 [Mikania micrantha]
MEIKEIALLRPRDASAPIEVRVIRKWNPLFRDNETCFLLVDRYGEAIVAIAHKEERRYVEPKLTVLSCYKIEDYVCVPANSYVNIINHTVALRIGAAASIEKLVDKETLPRLYFEFCPYENIDALLESSQHLIDYIGLITARNYKTKPNTGEPYLRLTLTNSSGQSIEVTIWKEIISKYDRFDKEAIDNAKHPAIVAATSLRVGQFQGQTQLSSTAATYVYLNPSINETSSLIDWAINFQVTNQQTQTTMLQPSHTLENKMTIADILEGDAKDFKGKTLMCSASIIDIVTTKDWYYNACPECLHTIYRSGKGWACPTHGKYEKSKQMYRLVVQIADNTGSTTATLFDEAVTTLLGTPCSELISKGGYTDLETVPAPLHALKGHNKTFFLQAQRDLRTGNTRCTVNTVSPDISQTENAATTSTPSLSLATPAPAPRTASSQSVISTTLQPEKSATTSTSKRTLFATPDTIVESSKFPRYPDD